MGSVAESIGKPALDYIQDVKQVYREEVPKVVTSTKQIIS
jgi:hypothetical protein